MPFLDSYRSGLVLAWMLRIGLYVGVLAILAITFTGCSVPKPSDILPKISADTAISSGEGNRTRNDEPQSGGCHEKSDYSPRKPLT